jgi:FKBP-type peptidyl-prolyl cis-trans isomerase
MYKYFFVIALLTAITCARPKQEAIRTFPHDAAVVVLREGSGTTGSGRVLQLHITSQTPAGVILFDSKTMRRGFRVTLDGKSAYNGGVFYRTMLSARNGDSLLLRVPAQNLYDSTLKSPVPGDVSPSDTITLRIGIAKSETIAENLKRRISEYEARKASLSAQQNAQTTADGEIIDRYLTQKNALFEQTPAGVRYMIAQPGSGRAPAPGDRVSVHYRGTLLDGTLFDTSYERKQPFEFTYGTGDVIFGFDEGVGLLREGGRATLLIPSPLAYGNQKRSELILENTILVFEIELLKVEPQAL